MNECNSIEIYKTHLTDQTKFGLKKNKQDWKLFRQEINQKISCSKKLSTYLAAFDDIDKVLIVLSAASDRVCIISSTSLVGAPVGITRASFALIFSLTTGTSKRLLNIRSKKEKHDKVLTLANSKLNSIETLVSQALITWK